MNAIAAPLLDRREEARVGGRSEGRMEALKGFFPQVGPIIIEEASCIGLRLRSQLQLHPNQVLVLRVPGMPQPIHASVQWVQEAPPASRGGHKAWIAGCRLHMKSTVRIQLGPKVEAMRPGAVWQTLFQVALLLAGAAAVTWLLLKFAIAFG